MFFKIAAAVTVLVFAVVTLVVVLQLSFDSPSASPTPRPLPTPTIRSHTCAGAGYITTVALPSGGYSQFCSKPVADQP